MKSRILIFAIAVLTAYATGAFAQPPDTLWTRTYGGTGSEQSFSVQQTQDGGYIITGYSMINWNYDVYLIKTDAQGDTIWTRTFGGTSVDYGEDVSQTSDGGYIIAGYTSSYGAGSNDVWLIKTDESGNQQWSQTFGGSSLDWAYSVQQTQDGGYIITGSTQSYGAGSHDVWLIKTDESGNQEWSRTFGGSAYDHGNSVQQTTDGGYIIAGVTLSYGAGSYDFWLIKTDASGTEEWNYTFGGTEDDQGNSVQQTADGGYIIAGHTTSYGAGDYDVYLVKTDGSGTEEWSQTYGGSDMDIGQGVQQTSDGGYIIAGYTESYGAGSKDVYLVKTNATGSEEWSQTYGGWDEDRGYSVQQTTDDGYIITGMTESYGAGNKDVYLIRLEAEEPSEVTLTLTPENPPIQIQAGGGSFNFGLEIDNPTTTNYTIDVSTNVTLPGGAIYPILARYNINLASGATISRNLTQFVPAGAPEGNYSYNGYVYDHTTWEVLAEDSFPFEKLAGDGLPTHNLGWALYGWDDESAPAASVPTEYATISAYPNPFNPETNLTISLQTAADVTLMIYDIQGREVARLMDAWYPSGTYQVSFDGSQLSSGMYFAFFRANETNRTVKLLLIK